MNISMVQGIYFLATGLWPVLNIKSFEKISGPKVDKWLVKTFGLLVAAVGIFLIFQMRDAKLLGVASALALALPEAYYSLAGRISKVYLLDSGIEAIFIFWWLAAG
jgi:energy-converting hydrogenase Eha subunit E